MSILPSVYNEDHPLNAWLRRMCPWLLVLLVVLVVFAQQFTTGFFSQVLEKPPAEMAASEALGDPGMSNFALQCKSTVKAWAQVRESLRGYELDEDEQREMDADIEADVERLREAAITRTERLWLGISLVEICGTERGLEVIQDVWRDAEADGALARDAQSLRRLYQPMTGEAPLDEGAREALVARHGWFGRLALVYGSHPQDRKREDLLSGMGWLLVVQSLSVLVLVVTVLVGFVLFFVVLHVLRGEMSGSRIDRVDAPAHVYGEAFVVGLVVFLVSTLTNLLLIGQSPVLGTVVSECLMWSEAAVIFWIIMRGVTWETARTDLGLNRGAGAWREMAAGVTGWLISAPVTLLVGIAARAFFPEPDEAIGGVPIFDVPRAGGWTGVMFAAVGAVVWAPLVEEFLFRGALHRYLPEGMRVAGRVAVTATIFGIVHPYDVAGVIQVGSAGVVFGLLREWRGSLIAAITAHYLHNATITAVDVGSLMAVA